MCPCITLTDGCDEIVLYRLRLLIFPCLPPLLIGLPVRSVWLKAACRGSLLWTDSLWWQVSPPDVLFCEASEAELTGAAVFCVFCVFSLFVCVEFGLHSATETFTVRFVCIDHSHACAEQIHSVWQSSFESVLFATVWGEEDKLLLDIRGRWIHHET